MKKIKAVILDLDQTLTVDQGSWLQFTKLLGADFNVHQDIFNKFKNGQLDYISAKKELIDLWGSVSSLEKQSIEELFCKIELRDGALEAVNYLKSKYSVCIISGAIDIFVEVISKKLGIKDYYASTKFIFNEENILVDFEYKLTRGEEKLEFFTSYISKYGFKPNECCAIGDGDSDIPIFEKVGLPILFIATETTSENKDKIKTHLKNWRGVSSIL